MKKKQNQLEKIEEDIVKNVEDIEKKVKREWKIINRFRKQNEDKLLFAAFIIILSSLVVINTVYVINRLPAKTPKPAGNTVINPQTILTSQQVASTPAFEVKVSGVKEDASPDSAASFNATETELILSVTVTNRTVVKQRFSPSTQLYLRSSLDGTIYRLATVSHIQNGLGFGDLETNGTASGQIAFIVPKVLTTPLLYVDLGWQDYTPVVFNIFK